MLDTMSDPKLTDYDDAEITPVMIRAGASVLCGFETYSTDEAYWAKETYRAMARAALHERRDCIV